MGIMSRKNTIKGLRIIIVGCGKVGVTLVAQLSKEGHDITIVDKNAEKVQTVSGIYDVMGMTGNGASYSLQMEAGIEDADLFIAVTDSDELNLLCCTVAKRVGNCAAIARVRMPDYSVEAGYLRDKLGIAMIINPEMEAARQAVRILYVPTALEVNSFAHGQAEMIKIKVPKGNMLAGKKIFELGKEFDMMDTLLICAVERGEDVHIPSGNFQIEEGDIISFVAPRMYAKAFLERIAFKTNQVKNCMIVGGGKVVYYLAKQLLHMGIAVKIIEKDRKRCEELSVMLPKAVIINGDGTDEELLKEEGIAHIESFLPLTGIDEENIMLTLYARQVSEAKVITKINRIGFREVINSLDLGSVIYPKYITAEAIIAYARAKKDSMDSNIETLYHMFDSRVEAIEFRVSKPSAVTGVPLMKLSLKKNLLISFINRNGGIIIPSGQDTIEVGDTVMIVTTHTGFDELEDILR